MMKTECREQTYRDVACSHKSVLAKNSGAPVIKRNIGTIKNPQKRLQMSSQTVDDPETRAETPEDIG